MVQDNQYYIIREFFQFSPNVKLIKEAIERGEPIILSGILQKANTLNRNGRVYPYDILRREATKYMKAVEENRALGECVPAGTEIYTKNGWFNVENIQIGDEIFTMNVEKNLLEIQEVTDTIEKNYNDQMIHIYNSDSLDMMVTKKHKIVLWDRNHKSYILTAEELYEKIKNNDSTVSHSYIKHSANWIGTEEEYFTLPNTDIKIKSEDWAAFLGIYIAEGHCSGTKGGKKTHIVGITQTKEESKQKIKELLDKLPFEYELKQNRQFLINNKDLHTHLFDLGYSHTKKIPAYAKDWSVNLLNILLEWMLIGDGKNRKDKYGKLLREYTTTSPQLSDDVFEIMLKIGNGATTSIIIPKDRIIEDRKILAENSKPLYIVHERTANGIYLDCRFIHADLVDFNENVYCVTVPNSTWLMRYNEKISWTHNCDHPDCQTSDSQILTEEGWKYLPEIKEDEKIFTLNLESNQVEIQTIEKKIDAPYSGKMFHLEGKGIDIITTPNHRFLTKNKNGDLNYYTAEELTKINKKELKLLKNIDYENNFTNFSLKNSYDELLTLENITIKELDFNDNVYCVRVKNGNFYTMRNGKSFWIGNSAVVSLRQSSHKVIDMWWQGEELYGKVEILDPDCDAARVLRGLLKSNVMLGISSRGVGSVKTIKGEDVVQDDFELIAFDFVSSPSTPGAYLFKENSNEKWGLTPITESHYKKIKWICENGVCRMSDMIKENNFEKEIKNIIPENSTIITQKDCMCTGYKKLFELSDNDFWKKI